MRLYELSQDGGLFTEAIRRFRAAEEARTGVHVSTLCDALCANLFRHSDDIDEATKFAFQELGNVYERILAAELAKIHGWVKPDPRTGNHGLIGSPDGYHPRSRRLDEVKVTWVNLRGRVPYVETDAKGRITFESPKWFRHRIQGTRYACDDLFPADRIHYHVFFVCADFTRKPKPKTYTLTLTDADKADVTAMLHQQQKDMGLL